MVIERQVEDEINSEPFLRLRVCDSKEDLIETEVYRINTYLRDFSVYKEKGIAHIIRLPSSIDPRTSIRQEEIYKVVTNEVEENWALYTNFRHEFESAYQQILVSGADRQAQQLMGLDAIFEFPVVPTSYGSVASAVDTFEGKPAFFRLNEFTPDLSHLFVGGCDRTPVERIVHEAYAHTVTQQLRANTVLDDRVELPHSTHHPYNERLMDLLGRTVLVRSGLMDRSQVAMQVKGVGEDGEVSQLIDRVYYGSKDVQSENNLPYDGNVTALISNLNEILLRS